MVQDVKESDEVRETLIFLSVCVQRACARVVQVVLLNQHLLLHFFVFVFYWAIFPNGICCFIKKNILMQSSTFFFFKGGVSLALALRASHKQKQTTNCSSCKT
jgi:hypothetical protein